MGKDLFSEESIRDAEAAVKPLALQLLALEPDNTGQFLAVTPQGKKILDRVTDKLTGMGYIIPDAQNIFKDVLWEISNKRGKGGQAVE